MSRHADDRIIVKRRPSTPGEILKGLYMEPLGLSVTALAEHLHISRKAVSSIINGHTGITTETAFKLAKTFNTTPNLWLNLQQKLDIWEMERSDLDLSCIGTIEFNSLENEQTEKDS